MKAFVYSALFLLAAVVLVASAVEQSNQNEYENVFKKFEHFIVKYGHKGLSFLKCMGHDWVKHCSGVTMHCLESHDVAECLELAKCEGKDAKECTHHIK